MKKRVIIVIAFAVTAVTLKGFSPSEGNGSDSVRSRVVEPGLTAVPSFPSELTVDELVLLANGNNAIQMGAFTRRSNAEALSDKIAGMTGLTLDIVEEGGLFKVFINSSLKGERPCLFIPVVFQGAPRVKEPAEEIRQPAVNDPVSPADVSPEQRTEGAMSNDTVSRQSGEETDSVPATAVIPAGELESEPQETTTAEPESAGARNTLQKLRSVFLLSGDNPWLARHNYFGKSVTLVNALIIAIVVSFATMLILLVVILFNRRRMEKESRLRQYLLEQYQTLIIDYLFGSSGPEPFRKIASDYYRRQVLIDQMIDVSVNLKGDSREKLKKLYLDLELDEDSLDRAYSRRWHKKIKGFRELAFMGITEGNDEMYRSLNSRNEILRMEAQIALVRLSEKDHFEFLSQLKRPFSLWEQITLHDLILQHDISVPDFQRWLNSENPTVVMFALRMIREFKQIEAEPEVRKVLLHREPRVSRLAVEVAGDLGMKTTLETMKRMYKFQEYNSCLEIVRSMGKMPETSMLGFLKLVLDKEDDVQLQIEAVKAIENMGEIGVQALVKIMKSEYKNYNIIVRHVLDRRIN